MEIKGLSMLDQLRSIRGVEGIIPKKESQEIDGGMGNEQGKGKRVSFAEYLSHQFEEVNRLGVEAEQAIQRSARGEEVNPHETMIAVQKADISMSLLMSVKDRIERAYQELIKTPV